MPVYSELVLRFTNRWREGDKIKFSTVYNDAVYLQEQWTWVLVRSAGFEVTTGLETVNAGERAAINFKAAFDLDFPTGYVTAIQNTNEVLIQSELENEFFVNVVTADNNFGRVVAEFDNDDPDDLIQDITVMVERYNITYCDDFNTDRQVLILERGFVGQALPLLADVNPISISYESSEDFKFSPIRPSTAQVNMIFGNGDGIDFEEFWTADERQFQVQDIKDGVIEWIGFVLADGFQYQFHGGLYHASIQASDGLGTLESIIFVDDNNKPYGNQDLVYNDEFSFPFSLIITEILNKLGLSLDLWTCVDSYEANMTKVGDVREADPLSAAFVNVKTYIKEGENEDVPYWYGSGEEWNCKEVLENILYIFGAKIYQEYGVWRLKTINADVNYGTGATQRYWRKYNNVGTYLENYEVIDDEVEIPCGDKTKYLISNDHVMSMDDVYKAFRMNYEFTFIRDGDSPYNILPNGDFCDFNNTSILAAPDHWYRWRRDNKYYIRIKDITIPFADAEGHTCGIEIGTHKAGIPTQQGNIRTDPNPAIWTSLKTNESELANRYVEKGAKLTFNAWMKYKFSNGLPGFLEQNYYPVFRMRLLTLSGGTTSGSNVYYLRNAVVENRRTLRWEEGELSDGFIGPFDTGETSFREIWFYLDFWTSINSTTSDTTTYDWWNFEFDLGPTPSAGYLEFEIHGLARNKGNNSNAYPGFISYKNYTELDDWLKPVRTNHWIDNGGSVPRLQMTGLKIGVIPNESELAQSQDFIYNNTNTNYSLQVDPITIYNGDLQDEYHISQITVPSNTTGDKNFWDDLGNTYGSSSLGLLTVREIMRQYQKPYRILEGNVKIQDARFGTVYTFEVLPGIRFILQRGTFNKQKQYIEDATFVQITSDVLPDGGSEGGNTIEPEWIPTGNAYCQIGDDGLNTGYVITEEIDVNPNSETYNETQEVVSDAQDLDSCPLSTPRLYYWGTDDIYLNLDTLLYFPFTEIDSKEIQIDMNNDEGNYLYFVALKTLGVVERIYTPTSPNNVLSDWVYLSDVIIDGYIYRVLRTDYVMTEFSNFTHNFRFA